MCLSSSLDVNTQNKLKTEFKILIHLDTADFKRHTLIDSCSSCAPAFDWVCTKCIKTIEVQAFFCAPSLSVFSLLRSVVCYPEDKHTGPSVGKRGYRDKALARIRSGHSILWLIPPIPQSESAHLQMLTSGCSAGRSRINSVWGFRVTMR